MKALALLSGGLDSTLAVRVVLDQGIELETVNFSTPFCQCNRKNGCGHSAKKVADKWGLKLKIFNITNEYLEIIKNPKHGYGKNLNPCIDCRILMHRKAKEYLRETGASFIITGEVLGQRPMSQYKAALRLIEKESGLEGLVLRPLSAKLLPPSIPEKEGWVDREKLLEICGRSRKPQIALAKGYKIDDYPCPAGGCLLTDPGFSRRMKDLMDYREVGLDNITLLKVGRHFRISAGAKVVIGRDEDDNNKILNLRKSGDIYFYPVKDKGPVALGRGKFGEEEIFLASKIIARYCDNQANGTFEIASSIWPDGKVKPIPAEPIEDKDLQRLRL